MIASLWALNVQPNTIRMFEFGLGSRTLSMCDRMSQGTVTSLAEISWIEIGVRSECLVLAKASAEARTVLAQFIAIRC